MTNAWSDGERSCLTGGDIVRGGRLVTGTTSLISLDAIQEAVRRYWDQVQEDVRASDYDPEMERNLLASFSNDCQLAIQETETWIAFIDISDQVFFSGSTAFQAAGYDWELDVGTDHLRPEVSEWLNEHCDGRWRKEEISLLLPDKGCIDQFRAFIVFDDVKTATAFKFRWM